MAPDEPVSREDLALALDELGTAYAETATRVASLEDELTALLLARPPVDDEEERQATDELVEAKHRQWYAEVVQRVRATVRAHVPRYARVAVVSKGDGELLDLEGREGWHFPQTETGLYAGHYPETGDHAVAHLEELRAKGADFLVVPASALWWLDHYLELRAYLESRCELVADDPESCLVYALRRDTVAQSAQGEVFESTGVGLQAGAWLDALLPPAAGVVVIGTVASSVELPDRPVWRLATTDPARPTPVDETLDEIESAAAAGASYAAVIGPPGRREQAFHMPLRQALGRMARPVAHQQLGDVFELTGRRSRFSEVGYRRLKRDVRGAVARTLPPGTTVYVVSKGDNELLDLGAREARHFPHSPDGGYACYHPADSAEALRLLDAARARGAEYLIVPSSSFWWFDHYPEFAAHLERGSKVIDADCCVAFALAPRTTEGGRWQRLRSALAQTTERADDKRSRAEA